MSPKHPLGHCSRPREPFRRSAPEPGPPEKTYFYRFNQSRESARNSSTISRVKPCAMRCSGGFSTSSYSQKERRSSQREKPPICHLPEFRVSCTRPRPQGRHCHGGIEYNPFDHVTSCRTPSPIGCLNDLLSILYDRNRNPEVVFRRSGAARMKSEVNQGRVAPDRSAHAECAVRRLPPWGCRIDALPDASVAPTWRSISRT